MPDVHRVTAPLLAAAVTGWSTAALPFYPTGWPLGLAALAGGLTALRPRAGLALALAAPVFPLGNLSLGLALLYAAVATAWLAFTWRSPREALLPAIGPLLGPISLLALLPLILVTVRSTVRRAVFAATAVVLAAIVAGIRRSPLPADRRIAAARPACGPRRAGRSGADGCSRRFRPYSPSSRSSSRPRPRRSPTSPVAVPGTSQASARR